MSRTAKSPSPVLILAALLAAAGSAGAQTKTLYIGMNGGTMEKAYTQYVFPAFEKAYGAKVVVVPGTSSDILAKAQANKDKPQMHVMFLDDGIMVRAIGMGLCQKQKPSQSLSEIYPAARFKDDMASGVSLGMTGLAYNAKMFKEKGWAPPTSWMDLADPKYKGKVCIRAGQHPYNTALVASLIAHDGEVKAEQWLRGVKANLARKATGGDRDVARDILGGICDVGLANSYYVGQMKSAKEGTDARKWGDAIKVIRPTFANAKSGGTHVNISGASVAKNAPQRANAVKLLEFLVSEPAQALYAQANYEYPVRKGVALDPIIGQTIGELKVDPLPLTEIAKYRKQASALVDKVGFDQ